MMLEIENIKFEVYDSRGDAYDEVAIRNRWDDVLNRYDYILGDWGHESLRLKGFFDDRNPKASYDNKFSTVKEYIDEFCNFGCRYFILKRVDE